jgi:hypothetical protein
MNCVYFGIEIIEHWVDTFEHPPHRATSADDEHNALFSKLINLYLLCEELLDFKAANMVIDQIIRFSFCAGVIPLLAPTSLAYNSTVQGSLLRKLLRDYWMYESGNIDRETLLAEDFPVECLQDIARTEISVTFVEAVHTTSPHSMGNTLLVEHRLRTRQITLHLSSRLRLCWPWIRAFVLAASL